LVVFFSLIFSPAAKAEFDGYVAVLLACCGLTALITTVVTAGFMKEYYEKRMSSELLQKIRKFFTQKNSLGEFLYPGASENIEAICFCLERGHDLDDDYNIAVLNA
jgi:hypothetical protein